MPDTLRPGMTYEKRLAEVRRGTGRTRRMIDAAIQNAANRRHSVVVFANDHLAQHGARLIAAIFGLPVIQGDRNFRIDWMGGITVIGAHDSRFSWDDMSYSGVRAVVFLDHFAVEDHYREILDLAHRWDCLPEEGQAIREKWQAENRAKHGESVYHSS
jgi:hypothetical protein